MLRSALVVASSVTLILFVIFCRLHKVHKNLFVRHKVLQRPSNLKARKLLWNLRIENRTEDAVVVYKIVPSFSLSFTHSDSGKEVEVPFEQFGQCLIIGQVPL